MEAPRTIPQLRQALIGCKAELLQLTAERQALAQGPGYYQALRQLEDRQKRLENDFDRAQKQLTQLQKTAQTSLL